MAVIDKLFSDPVWGRGFRPFFMAGAGFAVISLPYWALVFAGTLSGPVGHLADPMLWHAHEMIFGFTLAIISGFLLTAVANWTGWAPVRGAHLAALLAVWGAGRIFMSFSVLPAMAANFIDLLFIPLLAISLFVPLWKKRDIRNFVFLGLLTGLFLCNLGFHATASRDFLLAALLLVMTVVSIVGGRVVPSFTVAWLRFHGTPAVQRNLLIPDTIGGVLFIALSVLALFGQFEGVVFGGTSFILCGVLLWRISRHYPQKSLAEPMLWILHAGFAWMALGVFLLGLSAFDTVPLSIALHALTTGSIGSFVIGMISRVSLGHTGREIIAGKATVATFYMIQLAALLRVFAGFFVPELYVWWIGLSAVLWALAFGTFIVVYAPILWGRRADGLLA